MDRRSVLVGAKPRDRRLLLAGGAGVGARVVSLLAQLGSVAIATRALPQSDYGVVATLTVLVGVLGFADLGIGQGLLTLLSRADGGGRRGDIRSLVATAWPLLWACGLVIATLLIFSAFILPWQELLGAPSVGDTAITTSVIVFGAGLGLAVPGTLGQRVQFGLQRGHRAAGWQTASALAVLGATGGCALAAAALPWFVAAAIVVPAIVGLTQSMWVLARENERFGLALTQGSRAHVSELARTSALFLVLGLAIAIAYQTDALVVAAVLSATAAAVYAVSFRLFSVITSLSSSATQQFWPALAESLAGGDRAWVRNRFGRVTSGVAVVSACAGLGIVILGPWFIGWWVGQDFVPSRTLLIAFAVWTTYSLWMGQCSTLLSAAAIVKPQVVMAVLMTIANVPLSVVLTREIGLAGPLLGSLIAHAVFAGIPTLILVRRVLRGHA